MGLIPVVFSIILLYNSIYSMLRILSPVLCDFNMKEKSKNKEYRENLGEEGEEGERRDDGEDGEDGEIGRGREEERRGFTVNTKNKLTPIKSCHFL